MARGRKVALIRGINVGRSKRVPMADLRSLVADFGHADVRTVLNSGNVVFTAKDDTPAELATQIEKALLMRLDVTARVVVLTDAEMSAVMSENTLIDKADDPSKLIVAVPLAAADCSKLEPLLDQDWDEDAIALGSRAAYLWCAGGILESRLPPSVGRALKEAVTTRNWATMTKLHELMAAVD